MRPHRHTEPNHALSTKYSLPLTRTWASIILCLQLHCIACGGCLFPRVPTCVILRVSMQNRLLECLCNVQLPVQQCSWSRASGRTSVNNRHGRHTSIASADKHLPRMVWLHNHFVKTQTKPAKTGTVSVPTPARAMTNAKWFIPSSSTHMHAHTSTLDLPSHVHAQSTTAQNVFICSPATLLPIE